MRKLKVSCVDYYFMGMGSVGQSLNTKKEELPFQIIQTTPHKTPQQQVSTEKHLR
jgi:hypothetical protein